MPRTAIGAQKWKTAEVLVTSKQSSETGHGGTHL